MTSPKNAKPLPAAVLTEYVAAHFTRWQKIALEIYARYGASWIFDRTTLLNTAEKFSNTFKSQIANVDFFYAVKCNNLPHIAANLADANWQLDVSSGEELTLALATNAKKIIFSGPGKTPAEHRLASENRDRVTIILDSFGELFQLSSIAAKVGLPLNVGVRVRPPLKNSWRKFGIPLTDLIHFFNEAQNYRDYINLCGIHFHSSWNRTPTAQVKAIQKIGAVIKKMPPAMRQQIKFFDCGGGFWIERGEWLNYSTSTNYAPPHYFPTTPLSEFAYALATALQKYIFPFCEPQIYFEPGRWLVNDALHLVLGIIDVKTDDLAITELGTNVIGWEKYETDYAPILNLTHPELRARRAEIMGSLCTPHDWWGFDYFGQKLQRGDVLFIPDQGAYTYSLRQNFIKPLIPVIEADEIAV